MNLYFFCKYHWLLPPFNLIFARDICLPVENLTRNRFDRKPVHPVSEPNWCWKTSPVCSSKVKWFKETIDTNIFLENQINLLVHRCLMYLNYLLLSNANFSSTFFLHSGAKVFHSPPHFLVIALGLKGWFWCWLWEKDYGLNKRESIECTWQNSCLSIFPGRYDI